MPPDLETQLRPIGVADVEVLAVLEVDGGNPPIVDVHPVEAAVVDGNPTALVEPQHQVRARDQRMCDADIGAKVAADDYVVARREGSGRSVVSNGQRGRGWSAHRDQLYRYGPDSGAGLDRRQRARTSAAARGLTNNCWSFGESSAVAGVFVVSFHHGV
jgi:hypothetical protein